MLKLLKEKDPTLEVVPSKDGGSVLSDLCKFPSNETDYNNLFDHAIQKEPTEARKILVRHSLITNLRFSELKFQNAKLMDHMFKNRIYLKYNQSESLEVAALGFIQNVHPRITFRDEFTYNLGEAIHLEMTDTECTKINELIPPADDEAEDGEIIKPELKLEAICRTIAFGNGDDRIKTEAFEIRVPLPIRLVIKEIMTRLGNQNILPQGRFIPYGLVQSVGSDVYKKMIRMQNAYLSNFRHIPVFGLLPQALNHTITVDSAAENPRRMTVQQFITSQASIHGLETTNRTDDLGKVFLKTDATHILEARAFVDNVVKQLYESGTIPLEMILPAFSPPRRGDAVRTSVEFQSYASILANLGNPQEDGQAIPSGGNAPPPRPAKRNVQVIYDLTSDFPNLPRRTNQNNPDLQASVITQSINPQQDPSTNDTASSVTKDTLNQFKSDMKTELLEMIRKEVANQIQTQMQALQSEVSTMSAKIDGMSAAIKDSIGATVRTAIMESMSPQSHQPLSTQQFRPPEKDSSPVAFGNEQDGACPMVAGTIS